ncbi:MAG TPA: methyl-accepting chemotaxis protein [Burkholderiaceae bacterium]|nr:methyl-accepting chemotaxis protein [Burkholderiaceae bacterium]
MSNFRISTRLAMSFCFMLLLIVVLAGVGIWRMQAASSIVRNIIQVRLKTERLITEWEKLTALNALRTTAASKADNAATAAYFKEHMGTTSARISELQKAVDAAITDPGARALFNTVRQKRADYRDARSTALKAKASGNAQAAKQFFEKDMASYLSAYVGSVGNLLAYQKRLIDTNVSQLHADNRTGMLLVAGVAALAILAGIVFAWLITRSIVGPLRRAVGLAQTVSSRDLTAVIKVGGRDETGQLLRALKQMNDNLTGVVQEVRGGAEAIASASSQIAAGNTDLSSRTEEQASSLAETAATMEELTTTVRQNADNAQQASHLAEAAADVAVKGGDVVSRVVQSMGAIDESAKKVADIISVIDSIAFQTNILALNAAVEAARAGEQGRGFAVVATEVRALAQRSASAAKEIKGLIDLSASATAEGNTLAAEAGAAMAETVSSIQRVTDIVGEISAASREQTIGIEQVNVALSQMDQVTQQNAALVEEASAASDSLREQAASLADLVATFRLAAVERPRQALVEAQVPGIPRLPVGTVAALPA